MRSHQWIEAYSLFLICQLVLSGVGVLHGFCKVEIHLNSKFWITHEYMQGMRTMREAVAVSSEVQEPVLLSSLSTTTATGQEVGNWRSSAPPCTELNHWITNTEHLHTRIVSIQQTTETQTMDVVAILIFTGFVIGFCIIAAEDFGWEQENITSR